MTQTSFLQVVDGADATEGPDGVPLAMSPLEAVEVYARHVDELAANLERLRKVNRQQAAMIDTLTSAFGELHVVLDELSAALGGE